MAKPRRYRWNAAAQQYIDPTGRFVPRRRVRQAVDAAIRNEQRAIAADANRLRSGAMTLDEWYFRMRQRVKNVELFSASAARGGWAQLTQSDYGRVGAAVKKQYAYLDRFIGEIDAGYKLDGRFLVRAKSYANAGRTLYHELTGEAMEEAGYNEERNVLTPADHCDACVEQSARGWVPIGELIPIGERTCLGNCQCFIEYRERPPERRRAA